VREGGRVRACFCCGLAAWTHVSVRVFWGRERMRTDRFVGQEAFSMVECVYVRCMRRSVTYMCTHIHTHTHTRARACARPGPPGSPPVQHHPRPHGGHHPPRLQPLRGDLHRLVAEGDDCARGPGDAHPRHRRQVCACVLCWALVCECVCVCGGSWCQGRQRQTTYVPVAGFEPFVHPLTT
jgi:hypothetical protein